MERYVWVHFGPGAPISADRVSESWRASAAATDCFKFPPYRLAARSVFARKPACKSVVEHHEPAAAEDWAASICKSNRQ
jgi:hypothetical protein